VTEVVVAARDHAAGTVLAAADLRTVSMPVEVVPAGVVRRPADLVGQLAAGAIRRGETVTDARVVGPGLAAGIGPGESAVVPVRLADADSAVLVRPGDRVDVLGTPVTPDGAQPAVGDAVEVATGVRVLAVLGGREAADGVVLVVGTTQQTARRLVGAAARHRLTVSVRSP
jgi:Flp pilus assembly protein CpaB